jgi:hypothetical protein
VSVCLCVCVCVCLCASVCVAAVEAARCTLETLEVALAERPVDGERVCTVSTDARACRRSARGRECAAQHAACGGVSLAGAIASVAVSLAAVLCGHARVSACARAHGVDALTVRCCLAGVRRRSAMSSVSALCGSAQHSTTACARTPLRWCVRACVRVALTACCHSCTLFCAPTR